MKRMEQALFNSFCGLEMIAGECYREDARLHRLDYSHLWPSSWLLKLSKRDGRLQPCLPWVHSPLASGWDARSSYHTEIWRAERKSWLSIRKQELAITTSFPDILRCSLCYSCNMNWGVAPNLGALIPTLLACANDCLSLQIYRGSKCQGQFHLSLCFMCSWIIKTNPKKIIFLLFFPRDWLKCTDVSVHYLATCICFPPLLLSLCCHSLHLLPWAGLSLGCFFYLHSVCCGACLPLQHLATVLVPDTLSSMLSITRDSSSTSSFQNPPFLLPINLCPQMPPIQYWKYCVGICSFAKRPCLPVTSQRISRCSGCGACFSRRCESFCWIVDIWFGWDYETCCWLCEDNHISGQIAAQTTIELGNIKGPG